MVGLQLACRYKLEFPSRRKVKMLVDGGECAMKNGEPITKSILIADLPAGDKPWSCRPTMPAARRLFLVAFACSHAPVAVHSALTSGCPNRRKQQRIYRRVHV